MNLVKLVNLMLDIQLKDNHNLFIHLLKLKGYLVDNVCTDHLLGNLHAFSGKKIIKTTTVLRSFTFAVGILLSIIFQVQPGRRFARSSSSSSLSTTRAATTATRSLPKSLICSLSLLAPPRSLLGPTF